MPLLFCIFSEATHFEQKRNKRWMHVFLPDSAEDVLCGVYPSALPCSSAARLSNVGILLEVENCLQFILK